MNKKNIVKQMDHIIIPNATLKRFADDKNQIYYLDLNDVYDISVKREFPKSFHTCPNYYNPEYDDKVKICETKMGEWYHKILSALERKTSADIRIEKLKKDIIEFVTLECTRSIIADDGMLEELKIRGQNINDAIDSQMFRTGTITPERANYSRNFREKAEKNETFRPYVQNALGRKNQRIQKMYSQFTPRILYIPENCNCDFLLPPTHFAGNEAFLYFFLSPKIALALYLEPKMDSLFLPADKEKVKKINLRVLENVSVFDSQYREIVGKKEHLESIKNQMLKIKCACQVNERGIVVKGDEQIYFQNIIDVFEFIITIYLLFGKDNETVEISMKKNIFDMKVYDENKNEIEEWFKKYNFNLKIT